MRLTNEERETLDEFMADLPAQVGYYQSEDGLECKDVQQIMVGTDGFVAHCKATALKYLWRAGKKDSTTEAEDLRKASNYLLFAAKAIEANQ